MATIKVKSTSDLVSALKSAKSGDVISLSGGTYSGVNISNINIDGNVTIKSSGEKPAVLTDLTLRKSSGLTFANLEFGATSKTDIYPFEVLNSSRITFNKVSVHGSMNGNPADDQSLMLIRSSDTVTVKNSEFQQGWHGISHLDSKNVTITGNHFYDLRTDGVRGGGTSNLVISDNSFTDFYPKDGDHPDAIQLWTNNTTEPMRNITIANNTITRGDGAPVQGIFMRDTYLEHKFEKVSITGNTVVGAMYNGIAVSRIDGLTLTGNTVVAAEGQKSWISTQKVTDAKVTNNSATSFTIEQGDTVTTGSNLLVGSAGRAVLGRVNSTVANHTGVLAGLSASVRNLLVTQVAMLGMTDPSSQRDAVEAGMTFHEQVIVGTDGADKLSAAKIGDSRIEAGAGNDVLTGGGGGSAYLVGGRGDDTYNVRSADDFVVEKPGEGSDTVSAYIDYWLTDNVETLRMMAGGLVGHGNDLANRIIGSAGADVIYGEGGDDTVQAGLGDDKVYGGDGDDTLRGEDGHDWLYGEGGDDMLIGGEGNDVLDGGAGNDTLQGGSGVDRFVGGDGADVFLFRPGDLGKGAAAMEQIADFSSAEGDKINLGLIDARSATVADDKFAFIGTSAFGKVAGQLRYEVSGGNSVVMGDVDGDGVADFMIKLLGVTSLSGSDFAL